MSENRTPAEAACLYIMGRIIRDPQLTYLMGPGTEAYRQLTDVVGDLRGEGGDAYRAYIGPTLAAEAVVPRWMYEQAKENQ